jgi:hypothetical protein
MPFFGAMKTEEITKEFVQHFNAELERRNYAPHSVHHYHNVLSAVLTKVSNGD